MVQNPIKTVDKIQQKTPFLSFPLAVIKKYGDDKAGYLAALITYYGFLSLLPLLVVVTTILKITLKNNDALRARVSDAIGHYFPIVSNELQNNIHSLHKTGIALIIGILLTLYGARGGADALRYAFCRIWKVPEDEQPGFPKNILNSLLLIFIAGGSLLGAAVLTSYASGLTHFWYLRVIPIALSLLLLTGAFYLIYSVGIASRKLTRKDLLMSAIGAAVGVQILQSLGGYLLTHELKHMSSLYSSFALPLGLIFWIYLQVQVILYATTAAYVRASKTWPVRLS